MFMRPPPLLQNNSHTSRVFDIKFATSVIIRHNSAYKVPRQASTPKRKTPKTVSGLVKIPTLHQLSIVGAMTNDVSAS